MLNNPKFADVDVNKFEEAISKLPSRCDIRFIVVEPTMNDNLFDMIKIVRKLVNIVFTKRLKLHKNNM